VKLEALIVMGGSKLKKRLHPPGAGYGFRQNSMNLIQQVAGVHTLWKRLSVVTLQAGALDKIANFKVELII
jgi:hypothetical protein